MGLGAANTYLTHKLGLALAHELPFDALCQLVARAQEARTLTRSMGRAQRILSDPTRKPKRAKPLTLSSLEHFFAADVCSKLRLKNLGANGKPLSDFQIIQLLQQKGLL